MSIHKPGRPRPKPKPPKIIDAFQVVSWLFIASILLTQLWAWNHTPVYVINHNPGYPEMY